MAANLHLRKIQARVPQGSVLSPLLYILYTHDVPKSDVANVMLYADYTVIYRKDKKLIYAKIKLQSYISQLEWAIKVNPTKSALIIFTKAKNDNKEIQMYNEAIHPQKIIKYLGIHFDSGLTWKHHTTYAESSTIGKFIKAYP
ncbi:hypothetical protein PR048_002736 [Dryococelus australis]|uniref:Reverse transcriptase domain-containing protein n=1 Tax=Dryococelus australis TaxID=614101 RepID=A0ABQ9IL09_9NEOP|nr:hypothetical protein PR048_002736 [Dryococelus australis]